jgi:hypothetical protein
MKANVLPLGAVSPGKRKKLPTHGLNLKLLGIERYFREFCLLKKILSSG